MKAAVTVDHIYVSYRMVNSVSIKQSLIYRRGKNRPRIEEFQALKDISFEVERGHTIGVIGSNGAGKSTLLKTLAGIFQPDSGSVQLHSDSVSLLALGAGFENDLSGVENIYLNGILLGMNRKQLDDRLQGIIEFADIGDFVYKPVRTYSTGMRARLAFSIASNIQPDILLIDEMLGVGDEAFKEKSGAKIKEMITSSRTVILISHNMATIKEMCNQALWLEKGETQAFGVAEDVVNEYVSYIKRSRGKSK
ncbi:MAG: ABC transporter ATP-binding protein [Bellilinea sp.]